MIEEPKAAADIRTEPEISHNRPAPRKAPARPAKPRNDAMSGAAMFGYFAAFIMPLVGFLVGLALIARGDRHAVWITMISIGMLILYLALIT